MRRVDRAVGVAAMLMAVAGPLMMAAGPASGGAPAAVAATSLPTQGYRLRGYRWDVVLGRRWAVFEDVAHPERPLVSEIDPDGAVPVGTPPVSVLPLLRTTELVVHSGDAVTLWRVEGNVRMQLAAVAEGNAVLGGRVQLRVSGAGIFGSSGWRAAGIVRGPGSVEME